VFNLGHGELTDAEKTLTRRNLVAETHANLGGSEGETAIVVLDEAAEVNEHALGSLGAQVALAMASRTNLCVEHEVEGDGS